MNVLKNKLFWILILALFLRLYKLGEFPIGFHVDEVKVGWNAVSILKTGLDDHLNFLSLYYDSFGDYRPTGIFYFTIPSIILFGKSIFATRFPSALFGAVSVFAIYYLTKSVFRHKNIAFLASFLLAISTWHIEVSRATSEVVISSFFVIVALYFFIQLVNSNKREYLFLTLGSITISYFLYHAVRFTAPIFYLVILVYNLKNVTKKSFIALLFVIILSLFFSTTKEGLQRFNQVSIFKNVDIEYAINRIKSEDSQRNFIGNLFDNKYSTYSRYFIENYANYFSGGFLIGNEARPYRYTSPGVGLLSLIELILFIVGLSYIIKNKKGYIFLLLLLIAPLPAAITTEDSPNLHRAFLMLPFILVIEAYGLSQISKLKKLVYIFLVISLMFFLHMYFNHSVSHRPYLKDFFVDSPTYRNDGTPELMDKIILLQKNYDKVIITNFPDNPYPWYAFLTNQDPKVTNSTYSKTTNERPIQNLIFSEQKCPTDIDLTNFTNQKILMIDNWECGYESQIKAGQPMKVVDKVLRRDGSEVYILLENTNHQ